MNVNNAMIKDTSSSQLQNFNQIRDVAGVAAPTARFSHGPPPPSPCL